MDVFSVSSFSFVQYYDCAKFSPVCPVPRVRQVWMRARDPRGGAPLPLCFPGDEGIVASIIAEKPKTLPARGTPATAVRAEFEVDATVN